MRNFRAAWLIILVVVLLTIAVKPLRQQAMIPLNGNALLDTGQLGMEQQDRPPSPLDRLRARAPEFVKQRSPNDPNMLLAAGLLTPDQKAALELLKQAAEKGNSPAAWLAYCDALISQLPEWERLGEAGVDPARPDLVEQELERIRKSGHPDRLDPKAAAPLLAALAAWQKADPQNGLPLALEMRLRYGLHDVQQAQALWEAAGAKPHLKDYSQEQARLAGKLLSQLGLPEPEALIVTLGYASMGHQAPLRQSARIAQYEGKLAEMQGRNADAIRWWNSSIAFGRKLQGTSETIIGVLVGMAIEGIGASPTWKWQMDKATDTTGGPLFDGRIWYGRNHAFYVSQVGEEKDAEVRDSLVKSKVRSMLLRQETEGVMARLMASPVIRGVMLAASGVGAALFAAFCLLLFLIFGTWRRAPADAATRLRPVWQFLLALAPLALLALAGALAVGVTKRTAADPIPDVIALASVAIAVLMPIFQPLLAAAFTRAPGAKLGTAWRGNLRRTLPDTAAIAVLCFLALNLAAIGPRAEWVRQWSDPRMTEMAQVRQRLGAKWENPTISKDAWRAEYPKLKTR